MRDFAGNVSSLPILLGGTRIESYARAKSSRGSAEAAAFVGEASPALQSSMVARARRAFDALRDVDDAPWFATFAAASALFLDPSWGTSAGGTLEDDLGAVSATSGFPTHRVAGAWASLARTMSAMRTILAPQAPFGDVAAFRHGRAGQAWGLVPSGRCVAVRIPPSFPTIHVTWLLALAMRRPVVLVAPLEDPWTALRLATALQRSGLPEGALSLCYGSAEAAFRAADQVIWPGEAPADLPPCRVLSYHSGRCKVVMPGSRIPDDVIDRVVRLASEGSGRMCTNARAVLCSPGTEDEIGERLQAAFDRLKPRPLDAPDAVLAAVDERTSASVHVLFAAAQSRGARPHGRLPDSPRPFEVRVGNLRFLRPTAISTSRHDPLFAVELPFPVLTVSPVPDEAIVETCRGSLSVHVAAQARRLVRELLLEPSIQKVFDGPDFDRRYRPEEPHEGFLADRLFAKKASTLWREYR